MANELATTNTDAMLERVIAGGDLAALTAGQRTEYYMRLCESLGMNPLTRPFEYIVLNGKLTLYARRDATDQLRRLQHISVEISNRTKVDDLYVVTARASDPEGRSDESIGAVSVARLSGEALANALMKAECVPMDSEILTRDGFKFHHELEIGEQVLSYDIETDRCYWTPLLVTTRYDDMPLARLHSDKGQFDVFCTPQHSWAVRRALAYKPDRRSDGSRGPRGPYGNRGPLRALVDADKINTSQSIILAAPEVGPCDLAITPVQAAILGWAVTDGTIQRKGTFVRVGICQSKEENFAAIESLPEGYSHITRTVGHERDRTFPTGRTYHTRAQHWWYLPAQASRELLEAFGYTGRESLPSIATRISHEARVAMIEAMMLADGDKRGVFANSDTNILECFEILCALEGIATGQEHQRPAVTTIKVKKTRHVAGSFLNLEEAAPESVWCPTTEYGTWVMRQKGRVMITGNTKAKRRVTLSICGLGWTDETEVESIPTARPVVVREDGVIDVPERMVDGLQPAVSGNGHSETRTAKPTRPYTAEQVRAGIGRRIATDGGELASTAQQGFIAGTMEQLFPNVADKDGQKAARYAVTNYLLGKTSTKTLTAGECGALSKWMLTPDADGVDIIDDNAIIEAGRILEAVGAASGQVAMFEGAE